jgi:putative Mg2+ transporter-C (MgtC) family protein
MQAFEHSLEFLRAEMGTILSSTVVRLVLAAVLGGMIGLERELRHKAAGLRTNMLICFGAAMYTILSDELAKRFGGDHVRIAAQIIPGIGFIGAGTILRERGSIVGLTTAATIFVTASVGMAAGGGLYITAIFATIVILVALAVLGKLEDHFESRRQRKSASE